MYKIANCFFNICIESTELEECWKKFKIFNKNEQADIVFESMGFNQLNRDIAYMQLKNSDCIITIEEYVMVICENYSVAYTQNAKKEIYSTFLCYLFYSKSAQRRMIQFHSSLIDYQGRGLMFLGPSGIGKTTQAELWNQYRDALIISGDIVFVQETEEAFLGWGTPWHGSSPYCENTNVPVDALIILKQAPENSIRKLEGFEKVTAVSNSVFYPRWLENGMELCLETLDHLLSKIPVYELSCRPDEEAVELTEKTIFGREH